MFKGKARRAAFAIIVSMFLYFMAYSSASGQTEETAAPPAPPTLVMLKVMSINVRHNLDFWEDRFPLLADEIVRLKPDVIGFQEMHIGTNQSKTLMRLIRERASDTHYFVYEHLKTGTDMYYGEGVTVFSRFPIEKKSFESLGNGRVALFTRLRMSDSLAIDFYNTHLHHMGGDDVRMPQATLIVDMIKKNDAGYPTFLTGDMNASPDSGTIAAYLDFGLIDTFPAFHASDGEPGFTSPIVLARNNSAQNPRNRIDYVFFKPGADPKTTAQTLDSIVCFKNAAADGLYPSDHLGVMTTFEILKMP